MNIIVIHTRIQTPETTRTWTTSLEDSYLGNLRCLLLCDSSMTPKARVMEEKGDAADHLMVKTVELKAMMRNSSTGFWMFKLVFSISLSVEAVVPAILAPLLPDHHHHKIREPPHET